MIHPNKLSLMALAPLGYWEREYGHRAGVHWDVAASMLMGKSMVVGSFMSAEADKKTRRSVEK